MTLGEYIKKLESNMALMFKSSPYPNYKPIKTKTWQEVIRDIINQG